jgi:hypothetical protein
MFTRKFIVHSLACGLLLTGLAIPARATDGVIEINQAKINANGGFPYNINQSGSYRLTSNIIVSPGVSIGIQVNVDNVKIDLNGFSITPFSSSCAAYSVGIAANSNNNISVVNGIIASFGTGFAAASDAFVDKVNAIGNCSVGIEISSGTVSNSRLSSNGIGIYFGISGLAIGNYIESGSSYGIEFAQVGGYSNNVLYLNNNSTGTQVVGGTQMGTNVCTRVGTGGSLNSTCP